jgi:hypothetical protein
MVTVLKGNLPKGSWRVLEDAAPANPHGVSLGKRSARRVSQRGERRFRAGHGRHQTLLRGYYIIPVETTRNRAESADALESKGRRGARPAARCTLEWALREAW